MEMPTNGKLYELRVNGIAVKVLRAGRKASKIKYMEGRSVGTVTQVRNEALMPITGMED